jgi:hypothetical protein
MNEQTLQRTLRSTLVEGWWWHEEYARTPYIGTVTKAPDTIVLHGDPFIRRALERIDFARGHARYSIIRAILERIGQVDAEEVECGGVLFYPRDRRYGWGLPIRAWGVSDGTEFNEVMLFCSDWHGGYDEDVMARLPVVNAQGPPVSIELNPRIWPPPPESGEE